MNYLKLFEEYNNLNYDVINDLELNSIIQLDFEYGSVLIGECFGYDFLEDYCDEFNDYSFFIEIQDIKVNDEKRNKGYGTQMMKETIKFIYKKFGKIDIYLNASKTEPKSMSNKKLSEWYSNFGFKEILDEGNILMVKNP